VRPLVVVVEDNADMRDLVAEICADDFRVLTAADGERGLELIRANNPALVISDVMMPRLDGNELLRRLRDDPKTAPTPVILLTAKAGPEMRLEGLESGADDYLTKPFHSAELLARINALLRRAAGHGSSSVAFNGIEIDTLSQAVTSHGEAVQLTGHEYRILEYLMLHAGKVVSKTELTEHIYDQDFDRDSNVVEVLVGRIRKKLDPGGLRRPIETLRGRGYRFVRGSGTA
jgi:two-component system response regulator PhoP